MRANALYTVKFRKTFNGRFVGAMMLALCACACTSATQTSSQPGSSSNPQPSASSAPRGQQPPAAGSAAPGAPGNQSPSPSPGVPTPSAAPSVVHVGTNAPPRILSVSVSTTTVHSGDTVSGSVVTSSNVASVEARVATYGVTLLKTGVGRFAITYKLGWLPFFVHGTYELQIIARNARGDVAQQSLPITVR